MRIRERLLPWHRARSSYIDTHRFDTVRRGYATGNGNGMNRGRARLSHRFIHRANFYYCHVYRMLRGRNDSNIWPHPIREKVSLLPLSVIPFRLIIYYKSNFVSACMI